MIEEHLEQKAFRAVLDEIAKYVKHPEDKAELERLRKKYLKEAQGV